jgi:hypothetical protein
MPPSATDHGQQRMPLLEIDAMQIRESTMPATLTFDGRSLDPHRVVESIRSHGAALVRGAISPDAPISARSNLDTFHSALAERARADASEAERAKFILINGLSGPNLPDDLRRLVRELAGSSVMDCVAAYLGKAATVVAVNHFLFRRRSMQASQALRDAGYLHGFHQDHDHIPGAFPLNIWMPLSKVDASCVGLSFVFPYTERIFPQPFDVDDYLRQNQGTIWTPDVEPGDVLMFHRSTIHGTYADTSKPVPRYSAELRCGLLKDVPPAYVNDVIAFAPA